jgi:hypothetical protein
MKNTLLILATTLAFHVSALAQTKVPSLINYQGYVATSAGVPIGNGAPENRTITFRFWNSASETAAANRLYSESQTVTVLDGDFSVLIGNGAAVDGETNAVANVAGVFANKEVFLGITVDDGNPATTDAEITPRQQLVTTAFAFRATVAESVDNGAISNAMLDANAVNTDQLVASSVTNDKMAASSVTSANIVDGTITSADIGANAVGVTQIAANAVTAVKIADGSVTLGKIAANAVDSSKIVDGTVTGTDILNGTISLVDLAANAVDSSKIVDNSIKGSDILNSTITSSDLAANAVGTSQLAAGSVTYDKLAASNQLTVTATGVGIGTTNPTKAKLVVNGFVNSSSVTYAKGRDDWDNINDATLNWNLSIFASHGILADQFVAGSDARIKDVVGVSDSGSDLTVLQQIVVTDYRYRDWRDKGRGVIKKVIAQQVEKVYPQAVSTQTGVVPDIYQKAAINDGWVKVATNLKMGERVRLIGEKAEGIHEVLEVAEGKFRTDFKPEGDQVFVYGREVKDFRTVDYDAIAMLNVSATQELKREVDVLRAENARLRNVLEARLSALEQGRSEGDAVPVSASIPLR